MKKNTIIVIYFLLMAHVQLHAQSDGPRAHLPSPIGVSAINIKYMNLDQNLVASGNLLLKNANIDVDVLPVSLIHTFRVGKTWARVFAMAAPVINFQARTPATGLPINNIKTSGFSDGWVTFEIGIKGNPAKNIIEFSKQPPPKFTMNGLFRLWYSGTYDSDKFVNLGSNRTAFDFGFPMAVRLNNNVAKQLWLETWPGIQFYTANNKPAKPSTAKKITQRPLLYWENHLSYSFTTKFYAGVDLRFQQGGQTMHDDVRDNNTITTVGSGVFAGYKILPFVDFYANYGGILYGDNGASSQMIRLNLVVSYINMKKLQAPSKKIEEYQNTKN